MTDHQQDAFQDLPVTFSSNLAQQETIINVSYVLETPPPSAPPPTARPPLKTTKTPNTATKPKSYVSQQPKKNVLSEEASNYLVILVTIFAVIIASIVICLAVKQGAGQSQKGFSAHLPKTPQQAFSPVGTPAPNITGFQTPNLNQRTPPIPGQSGGQSAFQRTGLSGSPHGKGLFTQH